MVEGLRGELSGMVNAHERSTRAPVGLGKWLRGLGVHGGDGSGGPCRRENRAQGAVKGGNTRVEKTAWPHTFGHYYRGNPAAYRQAGRDALRGGLAFALAHLLEYTSPPFLARPAGTDPPFGAGKRHE